MSRFALFVPVLVLVLVSCAEPSLDALPETSPRLSVKVSASGLPAGLHSIVLPVKAIDVYLVDSPGEATVEPGEATGGKWVSLPSEGPVAVVEGKSGGLTAQLALRLKDRGERQPCFQLLVYPMIDDRSAVRTDVDESGFRLWDVAANAFGWRSYLGRSPGGEDVSDLAVPARRADLSGLPPAAVSVGTLDLFHDEDVAYARRLRAAGVPCELDVVEGAFHGFNRVAAKAEVTRKFRGVQVEALRKAFAG